MTYLRRYGSGFAQNAAKTLSTKIDLTPFGGHIAQPLLGKALRKYNQPVWLWDFQQKLIDMLHDDDEVYVVLPGNYFHLNIVEILQDQRGEVGDLVGWHRLFKGPWKHPTVVEVLEREVRPPQWLIPQILQLGIGEETEDFLVVRCSPDRAR